MLQIKDISYSVGSKKLLRHLTAHVMPGQLVAVVGPNGAGKSTLIKLISGELQPQTGSIQLNGTDISQYTAKQLAKQRAVLTQQLQQAFTFTVKEVVAMGRYPHFENHPTQTDTNTIDWAIEQLGLSFLENRHYNTLSGGEQQRTQLARVLAQVTGSQTKQPKLLLLDEPLNNLDIRQQHQSLQMAQDFVKEGNMAIAVLHDINMAAQYADRVLVLKQGYQLAYGPVSETITPEVLETCYGLPAMVLPHPIFDCPVAHFHIENEACHNGEPISLHQKEAVLVQ